MNCEVVTENLVLDAYFLNSCGLLWLGQMRSDLACELMVSCLDSLAVLDLQCHSRRC